MHEQPSPAPDASSKLHVETSAAADGSAPQIDWLAAARSMAAGDDPVLALGTDTGDVHLTATQYGAVEVFWEQQRANLAGVTPELVGRILGALRLVAALPAVPHADLECLIGHAATRGALPSLPAARSPSLQEVWNAVKRLKAGERTAAMLELQRAYFDPAVPVDEFTHLVFDAISP